MKSIKELLEKEYIGKEVTVYKITHLDGVVDNMVFSKDWNPLMSGNAITLKVLSVEEKEGSCCGLEYSLKLQGGFTLYME